MTEITPLRDGEYFHICLQKSYIYHKPMKRGDSFSVGQKHNPFYSFYEKAREYSVSAPNGPVKVPALTFLREINRGKIECPDLPRQALAIANHYNILAREIIMDDVRNRVAPKAPSRKSCLWVVDDFGLAEYWQKKLGTKASYIVRLQLEGNFHKGDATLLLNDSEPISETYERAEQYWQGHMQDDPLPEILFEGAALVLEDNIAPSS
ncbi:MAG: DUF2441 domain-containing protein [Kordiimonadaceae bacterium]|nr:DUF2441 domain-containing protein [Kordiimonadaceae bacterium]